MKRIFLLCIYIASVIINPVYAKTLEPEELLQRQAYFDEKNVCVKAEVLEVLKLKEGAWVNVGKDGSSLGLWLKSHDLIPEINYIASYKTSGDVVEACGVFFQSASHKHGELLLDVTEMSKISSGVTTIENVSEKKKEILNKAAVGLLIIILLFIIKRYFDGRRLKRNSSKSIS